VCAVASPELDRISYVLVLFESFPALLPARYLTSWRSFGERRVRSAALQCPAAAVAQPRGKPVNFLYMGSLFRFKKQSHSC
ncbi:MAG TPA: hypothetical protein VE914_19615, partial [Candidatus Angelobacter sp.]|nr:hypothetical protein [Candidatus Angelobacter sp.]